MGYVEHHAILVTSGHEAAAIEAHKQASGFGCRVTPVMQSAINDYHTFVVLPDGSMSGLEEDDRGNKRRNALIAWLAMQARCDWCEVVYSSDRGGAEVTRHAWIDHPADAGREA